MHTVHWISDSSVLRVSSSDTRMQVQILSGMGGVRGGEGEVSVMG